MQNKRVLLIDVLYKSGSTGNIVYNLYSAVNESGGVAAVCYGRGQKYREKNVFKFGIDLETKLHAFFTRLTGYTGCFSCFSTIRLISYIKKFKPDVVHIHELHAYFINLKPLLNYLKKNNIKTILTLHCEFDYTGKCGISKSCERWKTGCGKCPQKKDYPKTLFFDHTKSMWQKKRKLFLGFNNLTLVCPSEWLSERARKSFLGCYLVYTVNNGLDVSDFYPRETAEFKKRLGIKEDEKVILATAEDLMNGNKGGREILKLAKRMFDEKIRFILIGINGKLSGYPENVLVFSRTDSKDTLAKFYSLADAFIICSEFETFSMTCAEALCSGTPVVGYKCGAPETVFKSPYAEFCEYGDLDALCNLVTECLNKNISKDEVSAYGRGNFNIEKMTREYIKLYGLRQ